MRKDDLELREIDCDIVDQNRITVTIACARKDGRSGVKHDRNAIGFGGAINSLQFLHSVQIIIGKKKLVRRMNFDHANLQSQDLFDLRFDVARLSRMTTAARN